MNWLIAPVLASTGRVVTQSPSFHNSNLKPLFRAESLRFLPGRSRGISHRYALPRHSFLPADGSRGFRMGITPHGRSDARAAGHAEALIEQRLFQRRKEQQHVRLLAAVAHQSHAPDLALHGPESAGNLDIELVEELISHLYITHAARNHHCRDRRQA